jgi:hypothetical protein
MPQKTRWLAGPPIRLVAKASRLTSFLGFHDFRETRTAWDPTNENEGRGRLLATVTITSF